MQEINLQNAFRNIPSDLAEDCSMSDDEYEELVCAKENARKVERDFLDIRGDCPICGNKEQVWRWDRDLQMRVVSTCKCAYTERALQTVNRAGVCMDWEKKTLDSFHAPEQWQRSFKKSIVEYIAGGKGWLYVSGQSGCGKTHLCTAAFVELVSDGKFGRYTTWLNLMQKLDAAYYDNEAYLDILKPLTTCTVLYLDDMFKSHNNENISAREFSHTMRLIDARYQNPDNITLISSEWTIERLAAFDEALAGRIAERCGKNIIQIAKAEGRNHRIYSKKD